LKKKFRRQQEFLIDHRTILKENRNETSKEKEDSERKRKSESFQKERTFFFEKTNL